MATRSPASALTAIETRSMTRRPARLASDAVSRRGSVMSRKTRRPHPLEKVPEAPRLGTAQQASGNEMGSCQARRLRRRRRRGGRDVPIWNQSPGREARSGSFTLRTNHHSTAQPRVRLSRRDPEDDRALRARPRWALSWAFAGTGVDADAVGVRANVTITSAGRAPPLPPGGWPLVVWAEVAWSGRPTAPVSEDRPHRQAAINCTLFTPE